MTDPFVTHRSLLFTVAYEMLGSAADAEDVVQETWLRWADVDRAEVRDLVAGCGANVVGVEHHRLRPKLGLMEVELELALETRGADHSETVLSGLRSAGYPIER